MNTRVAIRDNKGRFIKGHPSIGGFNTRFMKNQYDWGEHPNFKNGIWNYQKFRKTNCEDCSSDNDLQVHHLDKNRQNNLIENLKTLCRNCHWGYHKNKVPWNKGKKIGSQTEEHRQRIGKGVRNHYAI